MVEARRWAHSEADAEDIVQEALIRAWRMRASCRTDGEPVAWLLQITRNEAHRARSRRMATEIVTDEPPLERAHADDPVDGSLLDRIEIRRALAALPPEDRLLLILRYGEDLTQPRVAELLGMPEGTAKVRLHRLRAALRRTLDSPS